jgi:hypothetical protein
MNKRCPVCKLFKDVSEFPKDKFKKDGLKCQCKLCSSEIARKYYKNNFAKILERDRKYGMTLKSKKMRRKSAIKQYHLHREKNLIRLKTRNFIKTGKLIKKPCQICGDINVQAHHIDYTKADLVEWYCPKHHRMIEGKQKYNLI